jgi:hypothetical protein
MLKIGERQANALRSASLEDYIVRLLAHLRRIFSDKCEAIGDDGLRTLIRVGMTKANNYGFVSELEICKYIDLMVIYGADFDSKPPWAAVFAKVKDQRAFAQAFDEAFDALLEQ